MIRILHVIGAMDRGGAETMIMNLYRAVNRDEVQFDFMVHEERKCDYDEEIESLGGRIYRMPRFNGVNLVSYLRGFRRFFAEHDEHPIVHGHIASSAAIYLREARRAGRFAIAHSHAQNYPLDPAQLAFRVVTYPTRFIADYFMACSFEAGRDRYGQKVVSGSSFRVLKNGIDLDQYLCDQSAHESSKKWLGYGEDTVLIGHVGRFDPVKNHRFLLDVFSLVKDGVPCARLVLVGRGGQLAEDLKREACERGLEDAIDFLGVREDIPHILEAFDAFVFPSFKEGLSIAVIEAQASGLPVLMSTGVPQAAALVDSVVRLPLAEGATRWAQACIDMLKSSGIRHDRVAEVREHGFDIEESAQWLEGFYRDRVAAVSG